MNSKATQRQAAEMLLDVGIRIPVIPAESSANERVSHPLLCIVRRQELSSGLPFAI